MQMFSPASRDTALRTAPTCLTIISDVLFHALSTQHGNEMSRTSTYHTGFPDSDPTTVVSPRFAQTSNAHDQIAPNHNARSRSEAHCLDMYLSHALVLTILLGFNTLKIPPTVRKMAKLCGGICSLCTSKIQDLSDVKFLVANLILQKDGVVVLVLLGR